MTQADQNRLIELAQARQLGGLIRPKLRPFRGSLNEVRTGSRRLLP